MGYRSTWRLAINASSKSELDNFIKWMNQYANDLSRTEDERNTMSFILGCQQNGFDPDPYTEFNDDWTKCYDPWDSVIDDIIDKVDSADRDILDCAYARFGEDCDDSEIRNGDNTYIYMSRALDDTDYYDLTPVQQSPKFDVGPDLVLDSKPKEEKCHCGRMKDYGQKCWWCDN